MLGQLPSDLSVQQKGVVARLLLRCTRALLLYRINEWTQIETREGGDEVPDVITHMCSHSLHKAVFAPKL